MPNQQRVPLSILQGDREADVHFGSSWMLRIGLHILSVFLVDGRKFVIYLQEAASPQRLQQLPFPHYSSCTFKAADQDSECITKFGIFPRNRSPSYRTAISGDQAPQMVSRIICADPSVHEGRLLCQRRYEPKCGSVGCDELSNPWCLPNEGRLRNAPGVAF